MFNMTFLFYIKVLIISPQNLHEDVIDLIGYTKLQHLHIVQNCYSPKDATVRLVDNYYKLIKYIILNTLIKLIFINLAFKKILDKDEKKQSSY